ncbi:hypothetical protein XENORESO_009463 [Xenotaenia resolanae]|uniref:Cytochrome P450 n=1 Tax=Xenotaenia resolanae TaxID=208358 RepID=A0ABV0W1Z3_9TELE
MIFQALFDSMDFSAWILLGFVLLLIFDFVKNGKPANFPPGPWAAPLVGNVLTSLDFKTMGKIAKQYGPVFSVRKGSERLVFISGHKMVKEALVNQLDSFVDRPVVPLFHVIFKGLGIALSNGYLWKKQRKFANAHLRYFGEGKKSLEKYIEVESNFLCEAFKDEQGRPFNPHYTLTNAVSNIISSVVFGHRFEYSDPSFREVLELDNEAVILSGSFQSQLYDAFPGLMKYLPGPHQTVHANYRRILTFLEKEIEKHIEEWNPDDPRDYIDAYLSEMEKVTHSNNMRLLSFSSIKILIFFCWRGGKLCGSSGIFDENTKFYRFCTVEKIVSKCLHMKSVVSNNVHLSVCVPFPRLPTFVLGGASLHSFAIPASGSQSDLHHPIRMCFSLQTHCFFAWTEKIELPGSEKKMLLRWSKAKRQQSFICGCTCRWCTCIC